MSIKNLSVRKFLRATALCSALVATAVLAQTPYDDGQKALREQQWIKAAEFFQEASRSDSRNTEAAMYWRAHALYKAGHTKEAGRQVRDLVRRAPESKWVSEARVLQAEYEGTAPVIAGSEQDQSGIDDELRVFALAQLAQRDIERALPLVLDFARNSKSERARMDALFILGMSETPQAQAAIAEIARDGSNQNLQINAIHMLGAASTPESLALLATLYEGTSDQQLRKAVVEAHIAGDSPKFLVQALRTETDPELLVDIIHALGAMDETSQLQEIYPTLTSQEIRVAALEAFMIAGDVGTLRTVLESETDPELRKVAIQGIAMEGGDDAVALIEAAYQKAGSVEAKGDILEAMVMLDGAEQLALKIIRTETNPELQKAAIEVLGVSDATDELAELYRTFDSTAVRMAVLNAMIIADDNDGLRAILATETDPELRAKAIQSLAVNAEPQSAAYLVSLYKTGSDEEKYAVIESLLIMEDAENLIALLRDESDSERKRHMLEMLMAMDSDVSNDYLFELLEKK